MNGGSTIIDMRGEPIRSDRGSDWPAMRLEPDPEPAEPVYELDVEAEPAGSGARHRLAAALALVAVAAWLGLVGWLLWDRLPLLGPLDAVTLAGAAATVPALIGVAWLLSMRTSRRESARFAATAAAMRAESARLEQALATMGLALERQRTALAQQIDQFAATGDVAEQRFATLSRGLAGEIAAADLHTQRLAEAAAAAQGQVGALLAALPRAHADTQEIAGVLERTGASAGQHAAALDAQLVALGERGREADAVAGGAAERLALHLQRMDQTSESAGARLEAVAGETSASVDAMLGRIANAVDEARRGISAQGDAMLAMVTAHQATLDSAARDSAEALAGRIASVEATIDRLAARLDQQREAGDGLVGGLHDGIGAVEARLDALHAQGVDRSQLLAASIAALGGSADAMTEALRAGETMATRTIGTTETLLIALDSAAREIDETLPEALARLDARIASSKSVVVQAKPELLALVTAAESTHDAIEAIADVIAEQRRSLDQLSQTLLETLTSGRGKADALGQMVDETIARSHRFAEEAAPRLVEALLRVRETASAAADKARDTLALVIPEAADALEAATGEALRRATGDTVRRQLQAVGEAGDAAVAAATGATERLARQVQAIAEQSALVAHSVEDAREEREAGDRDTISRRVAALVEALNSAAIDVTRALSPEVSDSAWAAYLKGDRGVFTRRAVRILDAGQANAVARLYDDDPAFREHVNRYIHDFEAMLRAILAGRDGSPIAVTLLSSDMGKLYVALAQAIERLR